MADTDLARRMFEAWNHLERKLGKRVTFAELGGLIAAAQPGRGEDYSASVVARWIKAEQEPKTRQGWAALAKALRVDPGWLTYGTGTMEAASSVADREPTIGAEPDVEPAPKRHGAAKATKRRKAAP